jgi:polysaccharide export outer membrane protein
MQNRRIILATLTLAVLAVITGCGSSYNPDDILAFKKPDNTIVTAENYILQPPDEIEIHCKAVMELDMQIQTIRPDGKISFQGIGEIIAAGKTPAQLALDLREKIVMLYALAGENPIDVRITVFKSKVYYVLGQVYFEGPKICTGRDTVLTALSAARPNIMAWKERVTIIRPSADPSIAPKIFEINYKDMMERGDISKNVLLEEGDIIYVRPTILAAVAMVIEEAVRPIGRAFSTVNIVSGTPGGGR